MLTRALHLVRYDLRSIAPIIAVWFGVLGLESLVLWAGPPSPDPNTRNAAVSFDLAVIVIRFAVAVVLVATLVHRHLLVGTTMFWRTRPMSRVEVLAAKATEVLILIIAVPVAWSTGTFLALGLDFPAVLRGAGYIGVEQTLVAGLVLALASVSANLAQIVVGGLGTLVLFTVGRAYFVGRPPRQALPFAITVDDADLVAVGLLLLPALLFVLVAVHQHLTLRTRRSIFSMAVILVGYVLLFRYPAWRVVARDPAAGESVGIEAPALELTAIRPNRISDFGGAPLRPSEVGSQARPGIRYWAQLRDAGVPGAVMVAPRSIASTIRFPDGTVATYQWGRPTDSVAVPGHHPDATVAEQPYASMAAAIGGTLLVDPRDVMGERYSVPILEVPEPTAVVRGQQRATLDVELTALAYRYAVIARLPLMAGASSAGSTGMYTSEGLESNAGGVRLRVHHVLLQLGSAWPVRYLLRNRANGQAILLASGGESFLRTTLFTGAGLGVMRRDLQAQLVDRPALAHVNDTWLKEAELVVMRKERLGTITRAIHIEPFSLDASPGAAAGPAGEETRPGDPR
ncbi:MAG: hypothetical protein AB1806_03785 [Acidobacteriota bacterium]